MDEKKSAELRKPFSKESVGLLPKPYKKDSPKGQCRDCGGWHGLPAVHLDYVGHAAVTDRLLKVDPEWSWEPMGIDQFGLPALDHAGNLWIRLTVAGMTRIGVGDGASMKERIGDAIRNAAMRFGVALDLWSREEIGGDQDQNTDPAADQPAVSAKQRAWDLTRKFKGDDRDQRTAFFNAALQARGVTPDTATDTDYTALAGEWAALDPEESR